MIGPRAVGFVVSTLLVLGAWSAIAGNSAIEDREYRFRLERPGAGWRVLGEEEIRAIVPGAVAGALAPDGAKSAVIAQAAPGVEIRGLARLLLDNMPLDQWKVERNEATTFRGRPAWRLVVSGYVSELHFRYANTIFRNGAFVFQIVSFALVSRAPIGFEKPMLEAFTILPGAVTGRRESGRVPDSEGVGWYVRDGKFASAALRLAVEPAEGWRVAIGGELDGMNGDAEVGLVRAVPDAYMVLIAERAVGVDQAAFIERVVGEWGDGAEPRPTGYEAAYRIGTRDLRMRAYRLGDRAELEFVKGAFFEDDICIQVLYWYVAGAGKEARALLPEAIGSIRILSVEEAEEVARRLAEGPDPENQVGAGYALRRGFYRDFEHRFTLRKPANAFWRLAAGDGARAQNADARLYLEQPTLGLMGLVIVEPASGFTEEQFHATVAESIFAGDRRVLRAGGREIRLGGGKARITEGDQRLDTLDFRYRVVTTLRGGFAFQFLFYGLARNVRAYPAALDRILAGVAFPEGLVAQEVAGTAVRDVRLGLAFDSLRPGWTRTDVTPAAIRPVGTLQAWKRNRSMVMVAALCAMQPGHDAAWFRDVVGDVITRRFETILRSRPEVSEAKLAGLPAERQSWPLPGGSNDVFLATRDRTFYMLMLVSPDGFPAAEIEALRQAFHFID